MRGGLDSEWFEYIVVRKPLYRAASNRMHRETVNDVRDNYRQANLVGIDQTKFSLGRWPWTFALADFLDSEFLMIGIELFRKHTYVTAEDSKKDKREIRKWRAIDRTGLVERRSVRWDREQLYRSSRWPYVRWRFVTWRIVPETPLMRIEATGIRNRKISSIVHYLSNEYP